MNTVLIRPHLLCILLKIVLPSVVFFAFLLWQRILVFLESIWMLPVVKVFLRRHGCELPLANFFQLLYWLMLVSLVGIAVPKKLLDLGCDLSVLAILVYHQLVFVRCFKITPIQICWFGMAVRGCHQWPQVDIQQAWG